MSGPDRIDPNDIQWTGQVGRAQTKGVQEEEKRDIDIRKGDVDVRTSEAKLPYVAPGAETDLALTQEKLEEAERENELLRGGVPLDNTQAEDLRDLVNAFEAGEYVARNFNPDYVGTVLDFPTNIESWAQQKLDPGIGTPGQATWWQFMNRMDLVERNKFFGATLTPTEKASWAATTISPGDTSEAAYNNLRQRMKLVQSVLARTTGSLRAAGAKPAQIEALLGPRFKDRFAGGEPPNTDDLFTVDAEGKPRYTPSQEQAARAYVDSPDFTPEGYASLLQKFARENGAEPTEEFLSGTLELGREIEARRQRGEKFGPGVQYRDLPAGTTGAASTETSAAELPEISISDMGLAALKNAPGSLAKFATDTAKGIWDLSSSGTWQPYAGTLGMLDNLARPLGELGASAAATQGIGSADPRLAELVGRYYSDRYGGGENIKRSFAADPAGVLADASTIATGMGGLAVRGGNLASRVSSLSRLGAALETGGRGAATAGRIIDPLSGALGAGEGLTALVSRYLPNSTKRAASNTVRAVTQDIPSELLSAPSGVGGETLRLAVGAGRSRGLAGRTTPRSAALRGQQKNIAPIEDILTEYEKGAARIREQASQRYQQDMAPITRDSRQIDFSEIEQSVAKLRPRGMGLYDTKRKVGADEAWTEADGLVKQHRALIDQDPARYATPAALDQFKQRLYETLAGYAEGSDQSAVRIAKGAYHAVKNTIVKHAPDYAKVMRDYERAQELLTQARKALTTKGNVDTSIRKLQGIMRRGDPGYAGKLVDTLDTGPTSHLRESIAGRVGEPWLPDSIRRAVIGFGNIGLHGPAIVSGLGLSATPTPFDLGMLGTGALATAAASPRAVTTAAYGAGRVLGAGERTAGTATDLYARNPSAALAGMDAIATGYRVQSEDERKRDLLRRYGIDLLEIPTM